jgi:E3 ubiquitin-protein ligase UBR4
LKDYGVYKPYLVFFALLDCVMCVMFKKCSVPVDSNWSAALAEYIRQNDLILTEQGAKVLSMLQEEIAPCESLAEMCDVLGEYMIRKIL